MNTVPTIKINLPYLEGKRLKVRPPRSSDIVQRQELGFNKDYYRNLGLERTSERPAAELRKQWFEDVDKNLDGSLSRIAQHQSGHIEVNGKWIGTVHLAQIDFRHLRASLTLGIYDRDSWGNGYGPEAMSLVIAYAFYSLRLHRVSGNIISFNTASLLAAKKVGFREEGILRDYFRLEGKIYNSTLLSVLSSEFTAFSECDQ